MDLHLKQWRNQQQESEHQHQHPSASSGSASVLPFFVPEPNNKICNLSAFPDSTTASSRFSRMGSQFSLGQWQELELQALIFRYMLAGAAVPPELLNPIKKSLLHGSPYFLHPHYQPAFLQSGYWGRAAMDPEPGRCRRTDGKKWRCSRDVVAAHKYCERHMHRGRNRSRKPVEIPTTITTTNSGGAGKTLKSNNGTHFALSEPLPSINLLHLNQSSSEFNTESKGIKEVQNEVTELNRSDGRILRCFFDDWPRSLDESDSVVSNSSPLNSSTDVSLKLSTGVGDEYSGEQHQQQVNWGTGWGSNPVASMGGPLAEALRSSASNSSPTSVLHQLPRGSASETSYIST